ncbi:hypothetical protein Ancab_005205 [Ancistrocladus abbreviatus]
MAFKQCFGRKSKSVSTMPTNIDSLDGCFDCNICLDFARDPVVTLCGHLYCWPCIYKWFHVQGASLASDEYPQCPVCKAEISDTTVVPLYGRGQTTNLPEREGKALSRGTTIPPRPPACGTRALLNAASEPSQQLPYRNPYQGQRYYHHPYGSQEDVVSPSALFGQGSNTTANVLHPVVEMIGDMFYARVFGNSQNLYAYPNSYYLIGSSSPRLRRQEMQAERSLNRISLFLLCCFLLCLLLF